MAKTVQTEAAKNKVTAVLVSLLLSYALTGLLLLLLALLLMKAKLGEPAVSITVAAIYIISCFVGGFLSGKKIKERKFVWGLAVGAGYFLILLGLSAALMPGAMAGADYVVSAFVLCAGGGMAGGMVS